MVLSQAAMVDELHGGEVYENHFQLPEKTSSGKKMDGPCSSCLIAFILGKRDRAEHTKTNPSAMNGASIELCSTMQQFFWLRLESIRRSRLRRGSSPQSDRVLAEVSELLDFDYDEHKGWAVIGKGPAATAEDDIIRLSGRKVMECLRRIHRWRLNAAELSFHRAVKVAGEAEERPCDETHTVVAPFEDGSTTKRVVTCDKCKRPMMKSVIYQ